MKFWNQPSRSALFPPPPPPTPLVVRVPPRVLLLLLLRLVAQRIVTTVGGRLVVHQMYGGRLGAVVAVVGRLLLLGLQLVHYMYDV